jgi:hypothetical protein
MIPYGRIYLLLLIVFELAACNSNPSVGSAKSDTLPPDKINHLDASQAEKQSLNCYRFVLKRDTILLQLRQTGDSISGFMAFDNYQKDSSHGEIKGYSNKDTMYVLYNFLSEGMRSVMEIALLKSGSSLIRGIGTMVNRNDTVFYKDHNSIHYQDGQKLDLIPCERLKGLKK